MKILVLQLARLGDIYLSWPALRALKRQHPGAEIHVLVRSKFSQAVQGLEVIDRVVEIPIKDILSPLFDLQLDVKTAHSRLSSFLDQLREENYDQIINLSFSPASSFLTHLIQRDEQQVRGYTRTSDGFLAIPDDMSAYFYAQVGPDKPNRFHLAEIFGTLCGSDLIESDWRAPQLPPLPLEMPKEYLVLHVAGSEKQKSISAEKWTSILAHFKQLNTTPVYLIGGPSDSLVAEKILASSPGNQVVSLVGKLSLFETMRLIQTAQAVIGPDSAPMHMASLTQTRCLNLSVGRVQFWETGPRAAGSWVIRSRTDEELLSDRVAKALDAMLRGQKAELGIVQSIPGTPSYQGLFPREAEFQWKLVEAVYQGAPFPDTDAPQFWQAHEQLVEINQFMIEQLESIQNGTPLSERAPFIDRGEEVIEAIAKLVPPWGVMIRWYQTEKVRIGPIEPDQVLQRTLEIQKLFHQILELYQDMKKSQTELQSEAP